MAQLGRELLSLDEGEGVGVGSGSVVRKKEV